MSQHACDGRDAVLASPDSAVTNARVFAIAGPAMLANLTTPLLGIVGTAAIGRLGEAHLLGGVAMSALVFDCLFWLFAFLRMGTVALTAQALGAGDAVEQRAVLARALLHRRRHRPAADCAAGAARRGDLPRCWAAATRCATAAETYFFVRIWSAPCALANFAVLGWLVGIARAGTALALQVAINVVNIALTVLLVLVLDYGIAGAAHRGCAGGDRRARARARHRLAACRRRPSKPCRIVLHRDKLVRMLAINRDIMIRTAALIAAFAFFTAQGARAGDVALAANAVLHNFILIGSFFLDGMATAAEQLCGRAVGARDRAAFVAGDAARAGLGLPVRRAPRARSSSLVGTTADRRDHHERRRCAQAARQFMLFAALAPVDGRRRLYLRRHLYRRDLGARHAQPDGDRARDLSRDLVGAAAATAIPGCGSRCWCSSRRADCCRRCAIRGWRKYRFQNEDLVRAGAARAPQGERAQFSAAQHAAPASDIPVSQFQTARANSTFRSRGAIAPGS